jgi:hypothetical protein
VVAFHPAENVAIYFSWTTVVSFHVYPFHSMAMNKLDSPSLKNVFPLTRKGDAFVLPSHGRASTFLALPQVHKQFEKYTLVAGSHLIT